MANAAFEIYDAVEDLGVTDEKARRAAEAIAAAPTSRFDKIDDRLEKIELRLEPLTGDVYLLKWMTGFNLALTVLVLGKLFLPA